MSNDFTGNPWKVDTVSAVSAIAAARVFNIYDIILTSASASGAAVVQDAAGNLKWEWSGDAVVYNGHDHFDPPLIFNGLLVPTLTSGTLKIYVKQMR